MNLKKMMGIHKLLLLLLLLLPGRVDPQFSAMERGIG